MMVNPNSISPNDRIGAMPATPNENNRVAGDPSVPLMGTPEAKLKSGKMPDSVALSYGKNFESIDEESIKSGLGKIGEDVDTLNEDREPNGLIEILASINPFLK
jgi:hypothetical protein